MLVEMIATFAFAQSGVPGPEAVATPARLIGGASARTDADYPAEALRLRQAGTTQVSLRIGTNSRISSCTVLASSGAPSLDRASCDSLVKLRFTPARNGKGRAIESDVVRRVGWALPE